MSLNLVTFRENIYQINDGSPRETTAGPLVYYVEKSNLRGWLHK